MPRDAFRLSLVPVGRVSPVDMDDLGRRLSDQGFQVTILPERDVPPEAYDARRRQYRAGTLLELVRSEAGDRVLAVTALDLYADDLNFIFGLAQSPGTVAVVSLYRLRAGADARLLRERALKEAVHELGHTFGLPHCPDARCVMHFSNCLEDTDQKGASFCRRCTPGHLHPLSPLMLGMPRILRPASPKLRQDRSSPRVSARKGRAM